MDWTQKYFNMVLELFNFFKNIHCIIGSDDQGLELQHPQINRMKKMKEWPLQKHDETKKYTVPSLETKMGYFNQAQQVGLVLDEGAREQSKLPLKVPLVVQ